MNRQKGIRFLSSRRNFVLAAFMLPLLINKLMTDLKNEEVNSLSSNKNEGFIIVAGWVLLNDDLTESLG